MDSIMPNCTASLDHFGCATDTKQIISGMNKTTCISDPLPIKLLMYHVYASILILQHIVNLCLTTGDFTNSYKSNCVMLFHITYKVGYKCEMASLRVYNDNCHYRWFF